MKFRSLSLTAVFAVVFLFGGCGFFGSFDKDRDGADNSLYKDTDGDGGYYYRWDGEEITSETAEENGCVMWGSTESTEWQVFLIDVNSSDKAEVTVCTEDSVMLISESSTGSTALVRIKQKDGDEVVESSRLISPVEVSCVYNDDTGELEYYLSDLLLNAIPASDNDGYVDVPVQSKFYRVSSTAAVTFPYQRYFSSYTEFESYYDKYNETLGLDGFKTDMQDLDSSGGFNTNVVFLYGERSGGVSGYEFLRAVVFGDEFWIYLKRKYNDNKGEFSKWQLTCTVPGEYLSNVPPDAVRWVIYDDEPAR